MKLSEMFPRRYATGDDLQGKAFNLTIERISRERMRPQPNSLEVDRWVAYFKETQKGVVLSRTLAYQIADILGSEDTSDWIGKKITLFPQPMMVAGRNVTAIRARAAREEINSNVLNILPAALMDEMEDDYDDLS